MKKVKVLLVLGLLLTFLTSAKSPFPPAKSSTLIIKGYVFKDDKKIDDAVIRLYQNNKVVQKTTSKKKKTTTRKKVKKKTVKKKKLSNWTKLVTELYKQNRLKDPSYMFKEALKEAAKIYKNK